MSDSGICPYATDNEFTRGLTELRACKLQPVPCPREGWQNRYHECPYYKMAQGGIRNNE